MKLLRRGCFQRMLIPFYVVRIILINMIADWAAPGVDSYDVRLAFTQIAKNRASGSAVLARDYKIPFARFADVEGHWGTILLEQRMPASAF